MFDDALDVAFLCDVIVRRTGYLGSDSSWMSLPQMQALLPHELRDPRSSRNTPAEHASTVAAEAWMEDPALWDFVRDGGDISCSGDTVIPRAQQVHEAVAEDSSSESELDVFEMMSTLFDRRAEIEELQDPGDLHFKWGVRGDKNTREQKGQAYDNYRAYAATIDADTFCVLYDFSKSASFSINRYDEEHCIILCKAWKARMEAWFEVWVSSGMNPEYRFRTDDIAQFVEAPEVGHLRATAAKCVKRIDTIRRLTPKGCTRG